ncbi:hypothetical protein M8818_006180 [Zalaria obscura]|uniref:Uncharacterized protein n=1 Tax=Zalaria obscura TaxID=2024903 RepID=A0ACC3S7K1_9PEZI
MRAFRVLVFIGPPRPIAASGRYARCPEPVLGKPSYMQFTLVEVFCRMQPDQGARSLWKGGIASNTDNVLYIGIARPV